MSYEIVGKYYTDIGISQDEFGPIAKITGNYEDGYTVHTGYKTMGPFRVKKEAWDYLCDFEEGIDLPIMSVRKEV